MSASDLKLTFDEKTKRHKVTAPTYTIEKTGTRWRPPFSDLFRYIDEYSDFYFEAERLDVPDENPRKAKILDDYTVTKMWAIDSSVIDSKLPELQSDIDRHIANISEGLRVMALPRHDAKPVHSVSFQIGAQLQALRERAERQKPISRTSKFIQSLRRKLRI